MAETETILKTEHIRETEQLIDYLKELDEREEYYLLGLLDRGLLVKLKLADNTRQQAV